MTPELNSASQEIAGQGFEIFIEGNYRHRSWRDIVLVVGPGGIGAAVSFASICSIGKARKISDFFDGNLMGAVMCLVSLAFGIWLFSVGVFYLWKMFTNGETAFHIDTTGIGVGKQLWNWEEIAFTDVVSAGIGQGLILRIGVRGGADRGIWMGRALSNDEYQALLDRLGPFLEKYHPEVRIG